MTVGRNRITAVVDQPQEDAAFAALAAQFDLRPSEDDPRLWLAPDLAAAFRQASLATYPALAEHQGERHVHRHQHHWNTIFTLTDADGISRMFYLKRRADGSLLNVLTGRLPRTAAAEEMAGIALVRQAGINTARPVAVGLRRVSPWRVESIFVSEALPANAVSGVRFMRRHYSKSLSRDHRNEKRQLIRRIAKLVARFHAAGLNHRDLYLNHIFVGDDHALHMIDLHRVQRHRFGRIRWIAKDLAQLATTAPPEATTRTDIARFWKHYRRNLDLSPAALRIVYHWTRMRLRHQQRRFDKSARKHRT